MKTSTLVRLHTSILDKLIDMDPHENQVGAKTQTLSLSNLRACVLRDVQNLLNSKTQWSTWPDWYKELEISLLNYGMSDLAGLAVISDARKREYCQDIKNILTRFEPRFTDIQVELLPSVKDNERMLPINITALLYADSDPEHVSFYSGMGTSHLGISLTESMT
ncbi:MAG: type VI secretion system baseplate subunit TssE [Psychromonas sp.]|nr:type VI secretion system baseplate subunit TssE [Psychromonas sp.]